RGESLRQLPLAQTASFGRVTIAAVAGNRVIDDLAGLQVMVQFPGCPLYQVVGELFQSAGLAQNRFWAATVQSQLV
ncbi:MAG: hypothetical protein AAGG53_15665, partial [Cyanobacteria bacterium P01_H01_bin.152]